MNKRESRPMLRDAWRAYVKTIVHPHSRQKAESLWRRHLEPLIGRLAIDELTDARLDELVAQLVARGLSSKSIRHSAWAFLASAVRHAKRARTISALPWDEFKPPRAVVKRRPSATTTVEQFRALVAAARAEDEADRDRFDRAAKKYRRAHRLSPLFDVERRIVVLGLCGLRNGEGAALAWDHVDFEAETITVEFQALDQWRRHFPKRTRPDFPVKNPKSAGPLVQRLHPDALAALAAQRAELERLGWYRPDGPVFPTVGGAWRENANCIYPEDSKRLATAAGIPNAARFVTHSLRHSFATLELRSGAAPYAVQQRIGHSTLSMLATYVHGAAHQPSAIPRLAHVEPDATVPAAAASGDATVLRELAELRGLVERMATTHGAPSPSGEDAASLLRELVALRRDLVELTARSELAASALDAHAVAKDFAEVRELVEHRARSYPLNERAVDQHAPPPELVERTAGVPDVVAAPGATFRSRLNDRDALVFDLRIAGKPRARRGEVAARLGVTRERVRQIEERLLRSCGVHAAAEEAEPPQAAPDSVGMTNNVIATEARAAGPTRRAGEVDMLALARAYVAAGGREELPAVIVRRAERAADHAASRARELGGAVDASAALARSHVVEAWERAVRAARRAHVRASSRADEPKTRRRSTPTRDLAREACAATVAQDDRTAMPGEVPRRALTRDLGRTHAAPPLGPTPHPTSTVEKNDVSPGQTQEPPKELPGEMHARASLAWVER